MSDSRDDAPAELPADLPVHARERLAQMRKSRLYTSDFSVNEFLLVKQAGFEPLGLVMGSSVYQIDPPMAEFLYTHEMSSLSQVLHDARDHAMTRMEEEAEALGADGIIGVRLRMNLHAFGQRMAEFVAIGTAVRHRGGAPYRNKKGRPFTSDLSGQEFWTLVQSGYRPVGFVMGNCAYYVTPQEVYQADGRSRNQELLPYTHALYDAREAAIDRLQAEAEALEAEGIVAVTIEEKQHRWSSAMGRGDSIFGGELLEFLVVGTAVIAIKDAEPVPVPTLVISAGK